MNSVPKGVCLKDQASRNMHADGITVSVKNTGQDYLDLRILIQEQVGWKFYEDTGNDNICHPRPVLSLQIFCTMTGSETMAGTFKLVFFPKVDL